MNADLCHIFHFNQELLGWLITQMLDYLRACIVKFYFKMLDKLEGPKYNKCDCDTKLRLHENIAAIQCLGFYLHLLKFVLGCVFLL